jgi:dolichol-phosphate mannosyltransferase
MNAQLAPVTHPSEAHTIWGAPALTVIAPVYNEEAILPHFYRRVIAALESLDEPFELLLIDDGSRDRSYEIMRGLHERDARVRVVSFSRNFGHQMAISAGLDLAQGKAVIIMDADLQDPPELIPALVQKWRAGGEVVYAQRTRRRGETLFKRLTASLFYRLIGRIASVPIPPDTGDFRLLDRRVVDALVTMRERHRFLRGLSSWVGFRQVAVPYEREERLAGKTKFPLWKMARFSLDAITGFSFAPLQLATACGFFVAGLSVLGILLAVVLRLFNVAIQGQATTLILVLFMGGVQLIFLGIIGEYLGRIYDEVRARPLYVVREELGPDNE